jgi:hypothetical protein
VSSVDDITQHDVEEVGFLDVSEVNDGESQDAVEDGQAVVDGLEGFLLKDGAPQQSTYAAGYGSTGSNYAEETVVGELDFHVCFVVDRYHLSEVGA